MRETTNVLIITIDFPPMIGGISTHVYQVAKNMGTKVAVLAPYYPGAEKFDEIQKFQTIRMRLIHVGFLDERLKNFLLFRLYFIAVLAFYVLLYGIKLKPKNIYVSYWYNVIPTLFASKLLKIPYYFAVHGTEVVKPTRNKVYRALLNLCVKYARKVICLGSYQKYSLAKQRMPLDKLCVVDEGVDLDSFDVDMGPSEIIEKHNLKGRKVILTVGRLVKRKGHDMVIKSLPNVLKAIPNAVYVIVGAGPELGSLKIVVKELNLSENVIFPGYVASKDLPNYYKACDVFVMASRELNGDIEGFGIVYLEANACGKPVIAGRSGGTGSAVKHGLNGLLIDPLDMNEISDKITLLLSNEELAKNMGMRGRKLVETQFSYSLVAKRILNIIEKP